MQRLDVTAVAREGAQLAGRAPLLALARLLDVIHPPAPAAGCDWQVQGLWRERPGSEPEVRLHLRGHTEAVLTCQRCLGPSTHGLTVDRRFRFVATEEEAERLDELAGDDEDVLALPLRLNLLELLEEELILALPLVALHEHCPEVPQALRASEAPGGAGVAEADEGERRDHPFAVLAQLKGKTPPKP